MEICPICYDEYNEIYIEKTICGHKFCKNCIRKWLKIHSECPICRKLLNNQIILYNVMKQILEEHYISYENLYIFCLDYNYIRINNGIAVLAI